MQVLALSSSRVGNSGFLEKALPLIQSFLPNRSANIAFIPFASVQRSYEDYGNTVKQALTSLPYTITTITPADTSFLQQADAIMIGGGNTFKLLHDIYENDVFDLIRTKVANGTPYIGWSAGANITGKSISTTNDMPIVEPESFSSFHFFPFQINPHYINEPVEGHNGETRDQRLEEFVLLHPGIPVIGLPEGTALQLKDEKLYFIGEKDGVLFQWKGGAVQKTPVVKGSDLSGLLLV